MLRGAAAAFPGALLGAAGVCAFWTLTGFAGLAAGLLMPTFLLVLDVDAVAAGAAAAAALDAILDARLLSGRMFLLWKHAP